KQYTAHTAQTTVARFAPSGYYVASGDVSGSVRVWDCVGEGATKGEYHIIGGRINDIAWDGDSQRIIAVGDGKQRFGHCITADSGNSAGEISGHSSQVNSVSIRQQRPLRAATGSDDKSLVFYHGAPFKFNTSLRGKHTNFVYGVAFSPDGGSLVSVGSDKKIWLYDGRTGEVKGQIGDGEHKGSIFGVSWAKDSKQFVTASADQTVKIWDAEAGKVVQNWRLGDEGVVSIANHQVGVAWPSGRSDGLVISLGLSGDLNYLVEGSPNPVRVVSGHQKNIISIGSSDHLGSKADILWTGSSEGRICSWDVTAGVGVSIERETHTNYVSGLAATNEGEGRVYSVGWDDTLRTMDPSTNTFIGGATKLAGQPKAVAASGNRVVIATTSGLEVFQDTKQVSQTTTQVEPTTIAAYKDTVAVGSSDGSVDIYTLSSSSSLESKTKITNSTSPVCSLAFSRNGAHLAVGNSSGKIVVFKTTDYSAAIDRWSSHTGRVTSIAWNPEGTLAVSGSLDTNIFVWSVASPERRAKAANAHKDGVNGVAWIEGGKKIISVGGDAAVKVWKVEGLS
ncbi:MAG: WD40 repeat-like protein, partial [Candelina submexicana]